ncbi:MAG: MFS transporter [candidate division KSB1 bacterium]|nr:MFS transporter [candidate division KSB1 bacterium]
MGESRAGLEGSGGRVGNFRWVIVGLVFLATTINYVDRMVMGILAPTLQREIQWSEHEYGYIVTAFTTAYAIGLVSMGRLTDVVGTKIGYAIALVGWSLAAMAHALARSPFGFAAARFGLGLFEAGNFPSAVKTVAEWFPKKERALATGLFNAGTNVGAILAPLIVPWLTLRWGWQEAFLVTGGLGFLWLFLWFGLYDRPERHRLLTRQEFEYIRSDPPDPEAKIPWRTLILHRETWAFATGKFLTDAAWWFYLFWIPKFLNERYGIGLTHVGLPLIVIYLSADLGSIGGGWLSSFFIRRGWSIDRSRKLAMLICALCVTPVTLASQAGSAWLAVGLFSLATASHQGWSANLFTLVTDMFPRKAVGSVVGLGGMAGAISGMLIASFTGWVLELTGSYVMPLLFAGVAYLLSLLIINLLVPEVRQVEFD